MRCRLKVNPSTLLKPPFPPTLPMRVTVMNAYSKSRHTRHGLWTPMVEAKAISMREHGESYRAIAEALGLAESSVRYHFKEMEENEEI